MYSLKECNDLFKLSRKQKTTVRKRLKKMRYYFHFLLSRFCDFLSRLGRVLITLFQRIFKPSTK